MANAGEYEPCLWLEAIRDTIQDVLFFGGRPDRTAANAAYSELVRALKAGRKHRPNIITATWAIDADTWANKLRDASAYVHAGHRPTPPADQAAAYNQAVAELKRLQEQLRHFNLYGRDAAAVVPLEADSPPCPQSPRHRNTRCHKEVKPFRYYVCDDCGHAWREHVVYPPQRSSGNSSARIAPPADEPRPTAETGNVTGSARAAKEAKSGSGKKRKRRGSRSDAARRPATVVDRDAYLGVTKLARRFHVPQNALEQRLKRYRRKNAAGAGWIENQERGPREPRYLYRVEDVQPVIDALRTTGEATGKRPAEKK